MDQMETREEFRDRLRDKKRIVVKIGSSSLQHPETGDLDYTKLDVLVREICDMRNKGKDVVLVTSGAIAVGKKAVHMKDCGRPGEKTINTLRPPNLFSLRENDCRETGLCSGGTGEADDDIPENFCGI